LLVVVLSLVALGEAAKPVPSWPSAFSTTLDLFRRSQHQFIFARWFRDEKSQLERFDTAGEHGWDNDIRRYDLGKRYNVYHTYDGEVTCVVTDLAKPIPVIDFSDYSFAGQVTINGIPSDEFDAPNHNYAIGAYFQDSLSSDPTRIVTSGPNDEVIDFFEFDRGTQDPNLFDIDVVAPNVVCNPQSRPVPDIRMAWLDGQNGEYYSPPAMAFDNVTQPRSCESGDASWYSCDGRGACGACSPSDFMAAHKTIACGTEVTVTDTKSGKSVKVKIGDRGPYVNGRILDLNKAPAEQLGIISAGVAPVRACW